MREKYRSVCGSNEEKREPEQQRVQKRDEKM